MKLRCANRVSNAPLYNAGYLIVSHEGKSVCSVNIRVVSIQIKDHSKRTGVVLGID